MARLLVILAGLVVSTGAWAQPAYTPRTIEAKSGNELSVRVFAAAGKLRLLWVPSEFGLKSGETGLAESLAKRGIEVWQPDLHANYFLIPGRQSYAPVPVADLADLIEAATEGAQAVYLLATGRGAALILEAANLWQQGHSADPRLAGAILLHPNMLVGIAEAGKSAEYLPISRATNLPLYIVQPVLSAKHYHLRELSALFSKAGATVYTHSLPEVSDGFASRPDPTPAEVEARERLPALIAQAIRLLAATPHPTSPPPSLTVAASGARETMRVNLQPIPDAPPAPPMAFEDLDGRTRRLEDYAGRVVLLNFWTTWCPPCVKELPSLQRLRLELADVPFAVVTVDVGEQPEQVRAFFERHGIEVGFPVLLDSQGRSVEDWRVIAFPTSFLLDRQGRLRYGLFGAIEWDAPETITLIQALLAEPTS
jgi:thiol-disulfide isomerase/thioredoxin